MRGGVACPNVHRFTWATPGRLNITVTRLHTFRGGPPGDVLGVVTPLRFFGDGFARDLVLIGTASLLVADSSALATDWRIHLYSSTPPSAFADNDTDDVLAGDRDVYLGFVTTGTTAAYPDRIAQAAAELERHGREADRSDPRTIRLTRTLVGDLALAVDWEGDHA